MGVITSKSRSTSSSQSNSKMGICIGRRLFKGSGLEVSPLGMGEAKSSSASSSSSSVLVVTQGDGAKKKEKATFLSVPTLVCPREGRDNETICTQETKSICLSMDTTREDNVEEKNFERPGLQVQKRDCFRTVSAPCEPARIQECLPGAIPQPPPVIRPPPHHHHHGHLSSTNPYNQIWLDSTEADESTLGRVKDHTCQPKKMGAAAPFCHPALLPLAASTSLCPPSASYSSVARSTGCIVSALAGGDPAGADRGLLHPAISNSNLSSRLRPREVRGDAGEVFAHPAVVSPGSVGALARDEMGRIGFGAIEQQADAETKEGAGETWAPRTANWKRFGAKLERQMSLQDIELDDITADKEGNAFPCHQVDLAAPSTSSSLSSLGILHDSSKKKARERSNSGLFKRHSFGTKADRKSTSVDNFLAVTTYGSSKEITSNCDVQNGRGRSGAAASKKEGSGDVFSFLAMKPPLMAFRKLRPTVSAAKAKSNSLEDLADIVTLSGEVATTRKAKQKGPGKRETSLARNQSLPVSHRKYRVNAKKLTEEEVKKRRAAAAVAVMKS